MAKDTETKVIIEDILGKDWTQMDPREGLAHLKIATENMGNIPGIVQHWTGEVEKRRKEIIEWRNRSFMQRASALLGGAKKTAPPSVTGEELIKFNSTKRAAPLLERLKRDPLDYEARIALVSAVGKSERVLPMEAYRALLLQAVVSHTFGEFSTPGLQVAIWAQNSYFAQLIFKSKEDLEMIKNKMQNPLFAAYSDGMRSIQQAIERNLRILNAYQLHAAKATDETKTHLNTTFRLNELDEYAKKKSESGNEDQGLKSQLFAKTNAVIHFLRYHLLLQPVAHQIAERLIKADENNALGYFLKGRIYMSELIFAVQKFMAGERSKESKQAVQERFKETYHQFGIAVNKSGDGSKTTLDQTVVFEYVGAILYFYKIAKEVLSLQLPRPWLAENLTKARTLLVRLHSKEKRKAELLESLQILMDEEKIKYS